MPDDGTEFERAIQALLDRYSKRRILSALQETPLRPGPKRKDDTDILIRMGRIMTWHRDLSDRAAAEIVTRHLPNDRRSVIDRIRKGFAKDREYYLRAGKVNEIINMVMAGKRAPSSTDKTQREGIKKSPGLPWHFPTMTLWKPCSRNYDQSCEPSARLLIRTQSWFIISWEKFGQNKSQLGADPARINPKRAKARDLYRSVLFI